ncbi:LEAF RUST 10 DISEASE-RESISTANCE LOCUS RECEPTOR-LIKE PROTEIN KINASE-like 2.8 [Syzygium oleosum]|uniref:LEAF RUST 10 DISEASE-RESISTANCE LOCUS RECEPTOR-LIKE PROTEIN KINASE-like 2.8 n=1 Tax=Syzygium oleosum TaxID=219896 RepID=UPI0024B91F6B|nr:LEAF RUST 10 DISEASE-RESISTANCE LOCUS RECEPTOR-LIKE PROTEIN KINASE-like 2.8 [Syzygium oleosum]
MIKSPSTISMFRILLLISHVLLLLGTSRGAKKNHSCAASSCGELHDIRYPFRLKGEPKGCGLSEYELACENNRTVLYLYAGRYYVTSISYNFYHGKDDFAGDIAVVDDGLQKGNCSSLPHYLFVPSNFSYLDPHQSFYINRPVMSVAFVKCSQPVASALYVDTKPCVDGAYFAYAVHGFNLQARDIEDSCTITMMAFTTYNTPRWEGNQYNQSLSYKDLHNTMVRGFNLFYGRRLCYKDFGFQMEILSRILLPSTDDSMRYFTLHFARVAERSLSFVLGYFLAEKFIIGACVLILLIYKWMTRHQAIDANIEEFLRAHNNFLPIRYSYSDIKKITKNFKYKLGEGGYGSVYRGILRSGIEVAVKILNKPESNGQDFINEVATIGRIHHVNVVQLVGFCFDYSEQALVYDFMPNGSLDKHISFKGGDDPLDYKKMHEISLGIARGIEYLHRGCDMQILHFDIKPHNILLDRSFIPKVSDFGLARLYPTGYSIVSLTAARGTLGYMAPELFYKDIGGVSYKADVYSFGMLLMEMAGRRRNLNAHAERSSQIYFPLWVYDQLSKEKEVEVVDVIEEERETTRKMMIVALWCIQLSPNDRPSMNKVLNMLEGDVDKLQLPPKPLLYPSGTPDDDVDAEIELETISSSSSAPVISGNYQLHQDSEFTKSCVV